jgi:hypothetical protein
LKKRKTRQVYSNQGYNSYNNYGYYNNNQQQQQQQQRYPINDPLNPLNQYPNNNQFSNNNPYPNEYPLSVNQNSAYQQQQQQQQQQQMTTLYAANNPYLVTTISPYNLLYNDPIYSNHENTQYNSNPLPDNNQYLGNQYVNSNMNPVVPNPNLGNQNQNYNYNSYNYNQQQEPQHNINGGPYDSEYEFLNHNRHNSEDIHKNPYLQVNDPNGYGFIDNNQYYNMHTTKRNNYEIKFPDNQYNNQMFLNNQNPVELFPNQFVVNSNSTKLPKTTMEWQTTPRQPALPGIEDKPVTLPGYYTQMPGVWATPPNVDGVQDTYSKSFNPYYGKDDYHWKPTGATPQNLWYSRYADLTVQIAAVPDSNDETWRNW